MEEEIPSTPPKPKQYLLVLGDEGVALLARLIPSVQFIPVEGFNLESSPTHTILVTPKGNKE